MPKKLGIKLCSVISTNMDYPHKYMQLKILFILVSSQAYIVGFVIPNLPAYLPDRQVSESIV